MTRLWNVCAVYRRSLVRGGLLVGVALVVEPSGLGAQSAQAPVWARVVDWVPSPGLVKNAEVRARLVATGLPWRVVDSASGVEFLLVAPGRYRRGAADDDPFDRSNERPQHEVTLTRPFYLGRYEVTNAQFRRWDAGHDSGTFDRQPSISLNGGDFPVVNVSWREAVGFAEHFHMRLPTEAEWEYAARAGVLTRYPWGNDPQQGSTWGNGFNQSVKTAIPEMEWDAFAWEDGWVATAPVGSFPANFWGFHDMFGNVWEYVRDAYDPGLYARLTPSEFDPVNEVGDGRTLRGGGFGNAPRGSGIPYRYGMPENSRHFGNGFRVARWP